MRRSFREVELDPVFQALDPRKRPFFMEAQWLTRRLNAFHDAGVQVAAVHPLRSFPHIKAPATFQMMMEDFSQGIYDDKHTIVIDSSGNTAHAVARLAPAYGFREIKVVLSSDVPDSKVGILDALSSVEVIKVPRGNSVAARALKEAEQVGHYRLNQYAHMGNIRAHELYTGPSLLAALAYDVDIVAVSLGSGGTASGVARWLKRQFRPSTIVIGVQPALGEQVPGARDERRMAEVVTLPWREILDAVVTVSRKESFKRTRLLWSEIEPQPGPTSGLAWGGLEVFLGSLSPGELEKFRGKRAAFICPDDGRFYSERFTGELDPDQGLVSEESSVTEPEPSVGAFDAYRKR